MALHWERIWPLFALALTLCVLFLAASWFGLWLAVSHLGPHRRRSRQRVGPRGHRRGRRAETPADMARKPWPPRRNSALAHRPATALSDELAIKYPGCRHPGAVGGASRARPGAGRTAQGRVTRAAPCGARSLGAALCRRPDRHCRFFVAGAEWEARLKAAFDWTAPPAPVAAFRIDGWIDPPAYTQVPPVLLDLRRTAGGPIRRLR